MIDEETGIRGSIPEDLAAWPAMQLENEIVTQIHVMHDFDVEFTLKPAWESLVRISNWISWD